MVSLVRMHVDLDTILISLSIVEQGLTSVAKKLLSSKALKENR